MGGNLLQSDVKTGFIPAEVSGLDAMKIRDVNKSCISRFNMAIDISGRVYSWGKNEAGQLGLGDSEDHETPQLIEELVGDDIVEIATGKSHALMLTKSGKVMAAGSNHFGQCGQGREIRALDKPKLVVHGDAEIVNVGCGENFSILLDRDGSIWSFGKSENGCLGRKTDDRLLRKVRNDVF